MKSRHFLKKSSSYYEDSFDILKNNIQFLSLIYKYKIILVTSALYKDGKTTVSKNLAAYLANSKKKVLLIDFDFNNPNLHNLFNTSNLNGISDILIGKTSLESCIVSTDITNLYVLTSGNYLNSPLDILFDNAIDDFFSAVRNNFDFAIIDSPPVLFSNYIKILAKTCDATVFVASYNKTDKDAIIKAKQILDISNANIIGSVLNKIPLNLMKKYSD